MSAKEVAKTAEGIAVLLSLVFGLHSLVGRFHRVSIFVNEDNYSQQCATGRRRCYGNAE